MPRVKKEHFTQIPRWIWAIGRVLYEDTMTPPRKRWLKEFGRWLLLLAVFLLFTYWYWGVALPA
jgi:hypothetical protein